VWFSQAKHQHHQYQADIHSLEQRIKKLENSNKKLERKALSKAPAPSEKEIDGGDDNSSDAGQSSMSSTEKLQMVKNMSRRSSAIFQGFHPRKLACKFY
jgi:hypothetical protein